MSFLEDSSLENILKHEMPPSLPEISPITPTKSSPDKKNRTPIKFSKTGEDIYSRGKEFLNTVELKRTEIANNEHSFKPKLNEKSVKLLKNALKEGRNPREKKPKEESKLGEDPEEEIGEEEAKDKKLKKQVDLKGFIERNYTNPTTHKRPVEKTEELDKECTFKPKISDKSKEMASAVSVDLFKQAEDIKRRKQEKIDKARKEKADKELDGCTFKPQITKSQANISPTGKARKTAELPTGYSKKPYKLFINV